MFVFGCCVSCVPCVCIVSRVSIVVLCVGVEVCVCVWVDVAVSRVAHRAEPSGTERNSRNQAT